MSVSSKFGAVVRANPDEIPNTSCTCCGQDLFRGHPPSVWQCNKCLNGAHIRCAFKLTHDAVVSNFTKLARCPNEGCGELLSAQDRDYISVRCVMELRKKVVDLEKEIRQLRDKHDEDIRKLNSRYEESHAAWQNERKDKDAAWKKEREDKDAAWEKKLADANEAWPECG